MKALPCCAATCQSGGDRGGLRRRRRGDGRVWKARFGRRLGSRVARRRQARGRAPKAPAAAPADRHAGRRLAGTKAAIVSFQTGLRTEMRRRDASCGLKPPDDGERGRRRSGRVCPPSRRSRAARPAARWRATTMAPATNARADPLGARRGAGAISRLGSTRAAISRPAAARSATASPAVVVIGEDHRARCPAARRSD